jgi:hypothetical protein
MSECTVPVEDELPASTPMTALAAARLQADAKLIAKVHGRRMAIRWLEWIEEDLIDTDSLEKVVLIRGEAQRALAVRNRGIALNWVRRLLPLVLRSIDGR